MTIIRKTLAASGDGLDFVLSDATVDRYGDVIEPAGWDLRWFKKNPIALFGHSAGSPIGTWTNIRVEGGKLIARLNFAAKGTSSRIDELISLVEQGILRAVSVGFRPLEQEPLDKDKPYAGQRYLKQELLETSLVSVPANPAALAVAKSLNVSSETLSLAFGEQADTRRRDLTTPGEHAAPLKSPRSIPRMESLSKRIENAQNDLNTKRDRLVELTGVDDMDLEAVEELNGQIEVAERSLAALKASEAKIGLNAAPAGKAEPQPRRPLGVGGKELSGMDLIVRAMTVRGIAQFDGRGKSIEDVLQERYGGHEATGVVLKADQTVGTTGTAGWASELVQTAYADFLQALQAYSIWPALLSRGASFTFDGHGDIVLPRRTAGGAGGGFVAEGSPIRVGRVTTASATLSPRKMGVIVPFTRELARRSTPAIEGIVRQAVLEDTRDTLDPIVLDATASSSSRPAGLLNGVSAVGVGFAGGDYQAVREDFKALLAPFYAANAADGIVVLMNPAQGLNMSMMEGPIGDPNWLQRIKDRVTIIESTNVTSGRLIALRGVDFAGGGGAPEFDVSEQATIHMEDTTPLEIVSGTGPTTADPVRSLWQTASIGVRMLMDVSWVMRRTGMVQWVNGTTW